MTGRPSEQGAACVFDDCPFEQSVRDDTSLAVALCPELQSRAGYDFPFESLARFCVGCSGKTGYLPSRSPKQAVSRIR